VTGPRDPRDLIVNFRDVGETLSDAFGVDSFPRGALFRGGRITEVQRHDELLDIPTILNLRPQKNDRRFDATWLRVPAKDGAAIYDTTTKSVRTWLNEALGALVGVETPVYVHCTSGKDRTGVLVATLLMVCDVPREVIEREYLVSDGDVDVRRIRAALDGLGDPETYLRKVDLALLRQTFMRDLA